MHCERPARVDGRATWIAPETKRLGLKQPGPPSLEHQKINCPVYLSHVLFIVLISLTRHSADRPTPFCNRSGNQTSSCLPVGLGTRTR